MEADASCEETAAEDEETVGQDTAEHRRAHDAELSLDEGQDCCAHGRADISWDLSRGKAGGGLTDDQFDGVSARDESPISGLSRLTKRYKHAPKCGIEETAERVSDSDREFLGGETEHRRERNDGCFAPSCGKESGRAADQQGIHGPRDDDVSVPKKEMQKVTVGDWCEKCMAQETCRRFASRSVSAYSF